MKYYAVVHWVGNVLTSGVLWATWGVVLFMMLAWCVFMIYWICVKGDGKSWSENENQKRVGGGGVEGAGGGGGCGGGGGGVCIYGRTTAN